MITIERMHCMKCGKDFPPKVDRYVCDVCGTEGILDIVYDYRRVSMSPEKLKANPDQSLWRYRALLPVADDVRLSPLHVGWTPMYRLPLVEENLHIHRVFIKDDGRNPTASLKDRASAVGVAKALEAKAKAICAASTGNAASSLAGFAASLGIPAVIFVPKRAPKAKVCQLLIYGAKTIIVDDSYDVAFDLSVQATAKYGFYSRNCAYNPYLIEGKKTAAFEMWEQMGFQIPDRVYVSIGDGCITSSLYKGFYDLMALKLIDRLPRIVAVQASGCNPVEVAFKTGEFKAQNGNTIADSIAVGIPRNRLKAMRALKESKGDCISVSEEAIKAALVDMPRTAAVFGEPAGVTAWAGFLQDAKANKIGNTETVIVLNTGNGLKDIDSALSVCQLPSPIAPNMEAVGKALN